MPQEKSVLVIDDDKELGELLIEYLGQFGFAVEAALHPDQGLAMLRARKPDLVVLDVMLPGRNGFEVCKEIRRDSTVPIIMLTARGEVSDRVLGLGLGADDYLPKPFEPRELVARIESLFRRTGEVKKRSSFRSGELRVDLDRHSAHLGNEPLELTRMEFQVLSLLASQAGTTVDRETLSAKVKGIDWDPLDRTLDVIMGRLRLKLGDDPRNPRFIRTVRGVGYLFVENVVWHE